MSDDKNQRSPQDASRIAADADTIGRAYHLKRADQEGERADAAVESGARSAHRGLEKLHRDRAGSDQPPVLLIARE